MRKRFSFNYPVTKARVDLQRKGGWRYDHVTDLNIKGIAYKNKAGALDSLEDKYDFDIEEILYEGKNIFPLLESMNNLDEINDACFHHIHHLFTGELSEYENVIPANAMSGKVITLPLKRKIN